MSNGKYSPGDLVKVVRIDNGITSKDLLGLVGTVREVEQLDNGENNYYVDGHYMHETEIEKYPDTKKIKLKDHPFFLGLKSGGMIYDGKSADKEITIVAKTGNYDDWAAYFETPDSHGRVAEYGAKMPESVAKFFFPDVAKNRKYRP